MQDKVSRRTILKTGLITSAILPLAGLNFRADAAALPALDASDPTAKALGFVTDASKVDAAAKVWAPKS